MIVNTIAILDTFVKIRLFSRLRQRPGLYFLSLRCLSSRVLYLWVLQRLWNSVCA